MANAYIKFNVLGGYNNGFTGNATSNFLHGDGSDILDSTRGLSSVSGNFSNYWALTSTNSNFNNLWTQLYQLGSYANLALLGTTVVESDNIASLEAQANFFIGYTYLRLGECFGGVPIVESFDQSLKFDYVRTTREETYDYAIKKLEAAAAALDRFPAEDGRLSQGIANHYLAEAYLAQAEETGKTSLLDKAIAAADKVIADHPLMTERFGSRSENGTQPAGVPDNGVERYRADGNVYFDLFQIGNYDYSAGNTEGLYVRQTPLHAQWVVSGGDVMPLGITIGPPYRDLSWSESITDNTSGPWKGSIPSSYIGGVGCAYLGGTTWGMIGSTDYLDEDIWEGVYSDDDRNAQINICDPIVLDSRSKYFGQTITPDMLADPARYSRISMKLTLQDQWGFDFEHSTAFGTSTCVYQFGRDWYIARSSETYLLRAEAYLKKGNNAKAAEDINAVRARAHASYMIPAGEVDIYTILDERARELTWEEFRWPTLLRMGGNGKNDVMKTQLKKASFGCNDVKAFNDKDFPSWTLFAIPFDVISLNSGAEMEQNPGW